MPYLQKTRIINLNYNDNRRTIDHQIFDFGKGDHTLFAMDNGLGKTVLIQFMMQPFVKNKRDLAGRNFQDYFINSDPTYIMHELFFEGNGEKPSTFLLVGMIIKKEIKEDSTDKLKILGFIHSYQEPNDYDLEHLPFIQDKKVLKFSEVETLLKNISKTNSNFAYFNFSDYEKRKAYFEILEKYHLYYQEWEDIIRKTNDDESGLSKLYDSNKDDEALLKNEIIPLIESKLATSDKKINVIRDNLKKFIKSFQKSKEGVVRLRIYERFKGEFDLLFSKIDDGLKQKDEIIRIKNKLRNIACLALDYQEQLKVELTDDLKAQDILKADIKRIHYENVSVKYYEKEIEINNLNQEVALLNQEIVFVDQEINSLTKNKAILTYTKLNFDGNTLHNQLIAIIEGIKNSTRTDSETKELINNYTYSLKDLVHSKIKELKELLENNHQEMLTVNEEIKTRKEELKIWKEKLNNCNQELTRINYQIDEFLKEGIFQEEDIKNNLDSINLEMNQVSAELQSLEALSLANKREVFKIQEAIKTEGDQLGDVRAKLASKEAAFQLYKQRLREIEMIAFKKGFSESPKTDLLIKKLQFELAGVEKEKQSIIIKIDDNKSKITLYQSGTITIPQGILNTLKEIGINFEYGLKYLQGLNSSEQKKLLNHNPFLPYSIILSRSNLEILKKEKVDGFTEYPIPLMGSINQEYIDQMENQVVSIGYYNFLVNFNDALLNSQKREELIKYLTNENQRLEKEKVKFDEAIKIIYQDLEIIKNFNPHEEGKYQTEVTNLEIQKKNLEENINSYTLSLKELQENSIHQEIILKVNQINELKRKKQDLEKYLERYHNYFENVTLSGTKKQTFQTILDSVNNIEALIEDRNLEIRKIELDSLNIKVELKKMEEKYLKYQNADDGEMINEDIDTLESKLNALLNKYDLHLSSLHFQKDDLTKRLDEINKQLEKIVLTYNLSETDLLNVHYYEEDEKAIERSINNLEKKKKEINNELNEWKVRIAVGRRDQEYLEKELNKLGFSSPLPTNSIGSHNFKERITEINTKIQANETIIKKKEKEINELNLLLNMMDTFITFGKDQKDKGATFDFSDLEAVKNEIKALKKQYEERERALSSCEEELQKEMRLLYERYRDQDYSLRDQLKNYLIKKSLLDAYQELQIFQSYLSNTIHRMELSLQHLQAEESIIHNDILRYCASCFEELKSIDTRSSITFNKRVQKLLSIELPEVVDEEAVKEFISNKVFEYSTLDDLEKLLTFEISTQSLMDKYLSGLSKIKIIIKKIEKNKLIPKTWKETLSQNSGGEKFVSMFILLACFLSYMRKSKINLGSNDDRKIIIMDNPFAKTNAIHLLEPLFEIASKYHIQLICFSGIGGSAVYEQFNRIYSAKALNLPNHKEQVSFTLEKEPSERVEFSEFCFEYQKG